MSFQAIHLLIVTKACLTPPTPPPHPTPTPRYSNPRLSFGIMSCLSTVDRGDNVFCVLSAAGIVLPPSSVVSTPCSAFYKQQVETERSANTDHLISGKSN